MSCRVAIRLVALATMCGGLVDRVAGDSPSSGDRAASHFLVLRLTPEAFGPLVDKPIDRTTGINELILGTHVTGVARTVGQPKVQLVNDSDRAGFMVTLTGSTVCRTTGHNSGVAVRTRTTTQFRSTKYVIFEPGEGFRSGPTTTHATSRCVTEGIDAGRGGLIGRIIQRRAAEQTSAQRGEDEQIAADRTRRRVSKLLDEYLEGRLARLNRMLAVRETLAIVRGTGIEPVLSCCSTPEHVLIVMSRGPHDSAALQLPPLEGHKPPIQFWIHSSALGGEAAKTLLQLVRAEQTVKNLLDWSRDILPNKVYSELTAREELPQLKLNFDRLDDWLVLEFGDRPPAAATLARLPR